MPAHIRPSIRLASLPIARPFHDRFRLAVEAGFEGVEVEVGAGPAGEIRDAAERAGLIVHSVHCLANYSHPLSSGDPGTLAFGIKATIDALETARALGADTLLLIPGKVDDNARYRDVYARSLEVIRRDILPAAEEKGIILAIENVWNGFLLSPIEYVQFIDAFESPFVRPYLDVGNIIFGRPEGWIDIAGARIIKLHVKDFRLDRSTGRFGLAKIGEGDINWTRVRAALDQAGFSGWATMSEVELIRGPNVSRVYYLLRKISAKLAPIPGVSAAFAPIQTYLARRLLLDVMKRFRRYLA